MKRGFLLAEETIKILLALIGLAFLAFFLFSIYGASFGSDKSISNSDSNDRSNINYNFQQRSEADVLNVINYARNNEIVNRKCNCGANCGDYSKDLNDVSNSEGIPDALLLLSLMMQESSCNPNSGAGSDSVGLMQTNLQYNCGKFGLPKDESSCKSLLITDSTVSISVGAKELKERYGMYKNGKIFSAACTDEYKQVKYYEWEAALRGYNGWGCYNVATDKYVDEVMQRYTELAASLNS